MNFTGIRNDKNEIIAIDIDFNCKNCGEPVRMRFNVKLSGFKKKLFLNQAAAQLCTCDFNPSYKCIQNSAEKLINILNEM
jgi:ArsR family metal-binding transcriptional regulator